MWWFIGSINHGIYRSVGGRLPSSYRVTGLYTHIRNGHSFLLFKGLRSLSSEVTVMCPGSLLFPPFFLLHRALYFLFLLLYLPPPLLTSFEYILFSLLSFLSYSYRLIYLHNTLSSRTHSSLTFHSTYFSSSLYPFILILSVHFIPCDIFLGLQLSLVRSLAWQTHISHACVSLTLLVSLLLLCCLFLTSHESVYSHYS